MSGIVFCKTTDLKRIVSFYTDIVKAEVWLDQGECVLLRHHNFLFGFCQSDSFTASDILTFFYEDKSAVLRMYERIKGKAVTQPKDNPQFRIYNFFARDPDGRTIEFQTFNHRLEPYLTGEQLLIHRRSVRKFTPEPVDDELLNRVFDICRYSPTSRNTQAFYFLLTRNKELIEKLAATKESGAIPMVRAPLNIAVCTDPEKTIRPEEDACIAATYLMLAAAQFGLGTCWIGGMNTPKVKSLLSIPESHYIACLTPIGYPQKIDMTLPERKSVPEFVREI